MRNGSKNDSMRATRSGGGKLKVKGHFDAATDGESYDVKGKKKTVTKGKKTKYKMKAKGTGYANPIKKIKDKKVVKDGVVVKDKSTTKYHSKKKMERKAKKAESKLGSVLAKVANKAISKDPYNGGGSQKVTPSRGLADIREERKQSRRVELAALQQKRHSGKK